MTGPTELMQQVAAFESVEAAVAAASLLVDRCQPGPGGVLPAVEPLPVGAQGRRIVFAEGGTFSVGGFFRRGNAVAVVQGSGRGAAATAQAALEQSFDRLCVYDRPEGC